MKKKRSGLILTAAVAAALCIFVVLFTGPKSDTQKETAAAGIDNQAGESADVAVIAEGEKLIIPVSEVTTEASFFPVEVDGTEMEVIAVRGSDDSIRTAFNTCQVCYASGRGYYVQQGDVLICQNCGNQFTADQIGREAGGCNPWPISDADKVVTEESVEIAYDFLAESEDIFANWRANY